MIRIYVLFPCHIYFFKNVMKKINEIHLPCLFLNEVTWALCDLQSCVINHWPNSSSQNHFGIQQVLPPACPYLSLALSPYYCWLWFFKMLPCVIVLSQVSLSFSVNALHFWVPSSHWRITTALGCISSGFPYLSPTDHTNCCLHFSQFISLLPAFCLIAIDPFKYTPGSSSMTPFLTIWSLLTFDFFMQYSPTLTQVQTMAFTTWEAGLVIIKSSSPSQLPRELIPASEGWMTPRAFPVVLGFRYTSLLEVPDKWKRAAFFQRFGIPFRERCLAQKLRLQLRQLISCQMAWVRSLAQDPDCMPYPLKNHHLPSSSSF